ncbi:hypothetical protein DRO30_03780, partial [Candidatus Bathyarchaeota archaeon]
AIPALLVFIILAGRSKNLWFSFILGGFGWIGALILRLIPLQAPILFLRCIYCHFQYILLCLCCITGWML